MASPRYEWTSQPSGPLLHFNRAMGNLQQSLVCFEKRLVVAHELGGCGSKAQAYGELGALHSQLGNYEQAISCLERQLAIARDTHDRLLEGDASCGLGAVYQSMGEYETALRCHQSDLEIAEEACSPARQARAYGNLGLTYESLGNYERAVVFQEQHLSVAAQTNDLAAKTLAYGSLGRTHHALQNYSQAVMYLQEGERLGFTNFRKSGVHSLLSLHHFLNLCIRRVLALYFCISASVQEFGRVGAQGACARIIPPCRGVCSTGSAALHAKLSGCAPSPFPCLPLAVFTPLYLLSSEGSLLPALPKDLFTPPLTDFCLTLHCSPQIMAKYREEGWAGRWGGATLLLCHREKKNHYVSSDTRRL